MIRLLTTIAIGLLAVSAQAENNGPPRLRIDASLYPYQNRVKNDVDFTTTINATLPKRFSYFSYINIKGVVRDGSTDFARSEQNLRYSISDKLPFDLSVQGVFAGGNGDDFHQFGLSWRIHNTPGWQEFFDRINLIYRLTFQLRRFNSNDNDAWQTEHFFRMTFPKISSRLYLSGFVDQTYNEDLPDAFPSSPIVAEIQLGTRLFDRFYAIGEYRINQKRLGDEHNVAVGVEYKFRW